ncbi:MAG: cytidine deaminase [Lachnospiraceae bacterium]|nr:cytidine deaminase [Lachnospiraceae bacterium]
MEKDQIIRLIEEAQRAREFSYSPYSNYMVGAALLTKDGEIYTGCNVENAAYSPTNCAERTAIFKAVSEGKKVFSAIAIVGGKRGGSGDYAAPCGVCRQVMMEFCNPETMQIIVAKNVSEYKLFTLEQLLPEGFGAENLEG